MEKETKNAFVRLEKKMDAHAAQTNKAIGKTNEAIEALAAHTDKAIETLAVSVANGFSAMHTEFNRLEDRVDMLDERVSTGFAEMSGDIGRIETEQIKTRHVIEKLEDSVHARDAILKSHSARLTRIEKHIRSSN